MTGDSPASGGGMGRRDALAALAWLADMGIDDMSGSAPVDRFTAPAQPRTDITTPPPSPPPTAPDTPRNAQPQTARDIARSCRSLPELAQALETFTACPLHKTATRTCVYDGNPQARVLLIGEAPGRDEDLQGKPFVGRSGQLLDLMLEAIGLSRHESDPARAVLITNMIFWRPPGNRKPTEDETLQCLPFIERIISLTGPAVIVCAGGTPTQRLTGRREGILRLRGRWLTLDNSGRTIDLLATLHPAYLLRQPAQKRLAWRDFLSLKQKLTEHQEKETMP